MLSRSRAGEQGRSMGNHGVVTDLNSSSGPFAENTERDPTVFPEAHWTSSIGRIKSHIPADLRPAADGDIQELYTIRNAHRVTEDDILEPGKRVDLALAALLRIELFVYKPFGHKAKPRGGAAGMSPL